MAREPRAAKRTTTKDADAAPAAQQDRFFIGEIPDTPENRKFYGELLQRYKDLPPALRAKMVKSELLGNAYDLRLNDILPRDGARDKITGELYADLQKRLKKLGREYTPLDFLETLMRHESAPFSIRFSAAKEALPYRHGKQAPAVPPATGRDGTQGTLVVPGTYDQDTWTQAANQHVGHLQKLRSAT